MRLLRRRSSDPVVHRTVSGSDALVVGLHGYGSDERQLETLLPLSLPAVTLVPRAPHRVDPGWGWWEPAVVDGVLQFAPPDAIDAAVERVTEHIRSAQTVEGVPAERTVLLGYSQGATLALSVAARHPELAGYVVTGAGFLLKNEQVVEGGRRLDLLVMNGSLDPLIDAAAHVDTELRFRGGGHRVESRIDHVPHVIDAAQAIHADTWLRRRYNEF